MSTKNLVLTGFMGCGKSSAGALAAIRLGCPFIETDEMIEKRAGISVSEIFKKHGEERFRKLERQAVTEAAAGSGCIIATGGGAVKDADNVAALRKTGVIIYLKCSAEKIFENIKEDGTRPLLQGDDKLERIKELLSGRECFYEGSADVTLDVTSLTIEETAEEIIRVYGECR